MPRIMRGIEMDGKGVLKCVVRGLQPDRSSDEADMPLSSFAWLFQVVDRRVNPIATKPSSARKTVGGAGTGVVARNEARV